MTLSRRSLLGFLAAAPFAGAAAAKADVKPMLAPNALPQFRRAMAEIPCEPRPPCVGPAQGLTMPLAEFHSRIADPAWAQVCIDAARSIYR